MCIRDSLNGVAQAALEQHGLVHFSHGLEQLEVLQMCIRDSTKIADANDFGDWEEQGCKG